MIFLFGSWFSSKNSAESVMDVGTDFIGMVKINTNLFCNEIYKILQMVGQEFLTLC